MKRAAAFFLALVLFTGNGKAAAVNDNAYYPEGPLWLDGVLYYAETPKHRIMAWDGERNRVFWSQPGCGPTSIAPYGGGFVILCHYAGKLVKIDKTGASLDEFTKDRDGNMFVNPNDSDADGRGGVYFSDSGQFDKEAQPTGAVYYLSPDGVIKRVASGLWYSNGVLADKGGARLFVSEHLGRRVLEYPIKRDASLGAAGTFLLLDALGLEASGYSHAGPDGLEMDAEGNLYVSEYGAGRVLVVDGKGKLLKTIEWSQKFLTNIALDSGHNAIFLTGASDNRRYPFPGKVERIPNPLTN